MVRLLQVNEKNSFAKECHRRRRREPGDAGVQGSHVLSDGGGVVAVEDLALRPLGTPVAGSAIGRKDRGTGRQIAGLRLIQRPNGGKDPQGLRVERVAAPLRDTVVVDGRVRRGHGPLRKTLPRVEIIAGEATAPLGGTGVVVEVGVAAAYGAPVEQALVFHVGALVEHAVQRFCLARPCAEDPGDPIGQPVRMAGPTAAPGVFRLLAFEIPRDDAADWRAEDIVVRNAKGGEESELADQDGVLETARGRGVLEAMSSWSVRQKPSSIFIDVTEKLASLLT
jgi:hypothetical protein